MSSKAAPRRARTGSARERAADVLVRVEIDRAYAAPLLAAALDRDPALSGADRGFATELVYGVLRSARALDARLQRLAPREGSLAKLDAFARAVLRIAAYEILALDRVPPRAAVNEAVRVLKRDRSPGLGGFANALLRKLALERPEPLPPTVRTELALAAVPDVIRARLAEALGGVSECDSVLRAMYSQPATACIRTEETRISRDALMTRLAGELPGASMQAGLVAPGAIRITHGGDLSATAAYREGLYALQEEGAQCVAWASEVAPGMRVLDACAGRGGKTAALASRMQGRGVLHAIERYPHKVERIEPELARLGLRGDSLEFVSAAADLTRGLGALAGAVPPGGYDVVVVDAPCSGLGTLARHPEIALRAQAAAGGGLVAADDAADVEGAEAVEDAGVGVAANESVSVVGLQRAILTRVAPLVRAGGVLLYAVCTLTREEGDEHVAWLRAGGAGGGVRFEWAEGGESVPAGLRAARCVLRPDRDGTDGFQLFRLRRAENA